MRRHESSMVTAQVKQIAQIFFPTQTEVLGVFKFSTDPITSSSLLGLSHI